MKKRVLILCTGNSARSQMAEGLLRHGAGAAFEVESAGTKPGTVRPEAIAAMREVGIDISGHRSKHVDEFDNRTFDYVITVCDNAKESCPVLPGAESGCIIASMTHHRFPLEPIENEWRYFDWCGMSCVGTCANSQVMPKAKKVNARA